MSRSGYSDDAENVALWRGMVASAIRGKRGQRLLLDLVQALDAMPEKRLIKGELITDAGEVCALGSVGVKRGIEMTGLDPEDADTVAARFDIAPCLAQEIEFLNDGDFDWKETTPEQRWQNMRAWAVRHLRPVDLVEVQTMEGDNG